MNTCLWEPEGLTEGRVTEWIVERVRRLEKHRLTVIMIIRTVAKKTSILIIHCILKELVIPTTIHYCGANIFNRRSIESCLLTDH